jgi:hypothetical protein
MSHIDTLKVYKEHVNAGYTEEQALAAVSALDEAFDGIDSVRKVELDYAISGVLNQFELLRKDFSGLKWLVVGMGALFAIPIVQNIITYIKS